MEHVIYKTIVGIPDKEVLADVIFLYTSLFESAQLEFFKERIFNKENLLILVAYQHTTPVGFKIGYRYNETTFYSWIGGVLKAYRKNKIGQKLMSLQHQIVKEKGFTRVRTKSMNTYKPMMILNLLQGFDIIKVYTNEVNQTKIVFEKDL